MVVYFFVVYVWWFLGFGFGKVQAEASNTIDEDDKSDSTDTILDKLLDLNKGMEPLFGKAGKTTTLDSEGSNTITHDIEASSSATEI